MTKAHLGINTSKDHKTRGRLIELVIALSVGLLFALGVLVILTMGNWLLWEEDAMGDFDGYVVNATEEQMISLDENFDTGRKYIFGYVGRKEIYAVDSSFYAQYDFELINGMFPQEKNEIVLSETAAKFEGVAMNDTVTVSIRREDKEYDASFTVVGIVKDSKFKDLEKSTYLLSDKFRSEAGYWEDVYVIKKVFGGSIDRQLLEYDIESNQVRSMLGDGSMVSGLMIPTVFVSGAILALSITAISSIFSYSINERIRTIGLLKSIGTTNKQLKHAHLKDAYHHMVRGYLLGILVGIVAFFMVIYLPLILRGDMSLNDSLMANLHVDMYKVDRVWILFAGMIVVVTLLTFITVRISILIPFKKANKISIIESVRYQTAVPKRKFKKTSTISNPSVRLSLIHFFNNKSKSILPTIMLSISAALFIFFASFLNSMDSRVLAENNFEGDVLVEGSFNRSDVLELTQFNDNYGLFGTKEVEIDFNVIEYANPENYDTVNYLKEFYDKAPTKLIGLNEGSFEEYGIDSLGEGEVYIYSWRNQVIVPESGVIEIYIDGVPYEFTIKEFIDTREVPTSSNGIPMFIINDSFVDNDLMTYSKVFFFENDQTDLKNKIQNFNDTYEVNTLDEYELSLRKENSMITSLGMGLLSVVGLISLTMIINNVYTSVSSRKQEVAVLKSIGMTRKQLLRYFSIENYIYVIITAIISVPMGYSLGKFVVEKLAEMNEHFQWHFQPLSLLVIVVCYFVLSFVTHRTLLAHEKNSIAELVRE